MEVVIERAEKSQITAIYNIQQGLAVEWGDHEWEEESWLLKKIEVGECYVARCDIRIGAVMCVGTFGEVFEIESLIVKPEFQKKQVGRKLVEFAKELWRSSGKMVLHVGTFFEYEADGFYEKCGFIKDSVRSCKDHEYHRMVYTE